MNIDGQNFQYARLIVDSHPDSLKKVISWFEIFQKSFIPRKVWLECQTMLGESFDNVLFHAHKKLPQETPIEIEVIVSSQLIILKVWDFGSGFNIQIQKNKIIQGVEKSAESGRGIEILEHTADHINYMNSEEGNYLLIVKMFIPLSAILPDLS